MKPASRVRAHTSIHAVRSPYSVLHARYMYVYAHAARCGLVRSAMQCRVGRIYISSYDKLLLSPADDPAGRGESYSNTWPDTHSVILEKRTYLLYSMFGSYLPTSVLISNQKDPSNLHACALHPATAQHHDVTCPLLFALLTPLSLLFNLRRKYLPTLPMENVATNCSS